MKFDLGKKIVNIPKGTVVDAGDYFTHTSSPETEPKWFTLVVGEKGVIGLRVGVQPVVDELGALTHIEGASAKQVAAGEQSKA